MLKCVTCGTIGSYENELIDISDWNCIMAKCENCMANKVIKEDVRKEYVYYGDDGMSGMKEVTVKTNYFFDQPLKAWFNHDYLTFHEDFKFGDDLVVFAETVDSDDPKGTYWYQVYNPRIGQSATLNSQYIVFDIGDLDI